MSAGGCPRLFQAEAMRDGRLTGAERASFERHIAICAACSREVQALDALAEAVGTIPTDPGEFHVRRERTRLLAAFDGVLVAPESSHFRPRSLRPLLWSAALAAVCLGAVLVVSPLRRATPSVETSNVVIQADVDALWSRRLAGDQERVVLERGILSIRVEHSSGNARLIVVLPDGDLEDIGTTFTVSAEGGRTTRVAVREGHVVLRLRGQPALTIGPGNTWIPSVPTSIAGDTSTPPAESLLVGAEPNAPSAPSLRPSAASSSAAQPDVGARSSAADFRAAMDAFARGDNSQAATMFGSFIHKYPHDPRAEDAAYSRVIALQRCGDIGRMKDAAREYLQRYPSGFRRREVEPLSP